MKSPHSVSVPLKIHVLTALCLATSFAGAERFSLSPVGESTPSSVKATPVAADANVVKVTGRGVGTDRASALKDAYRDAVERAVGLYVDAEQMAKNDEIVSDQILTQSNAYIEKCDIIKESTANGLVTIKVLALVRKQKLTKRMKDVMPPQTYDFSKGDAASAHASMVTEAKRNEDAAALVQNYFKDFNPVLQLMKAGLASVKPQVIKDPKNPDSVELAYPLKVEVDQKKYFELVMPALKRIFDQISLTQPKKIRLADGANKILVFRAHERDRDVAAFYKTFMLDCKYPEGATPWGLRLKGCYAGLHAYYGNVDGKSRGFSSGPTYGNMDFGKIDNRIESLDSRMESSTMSAGLKSNEKCGVLLYTSVSATGANAVLYTVNPAVMTVLADWQKKVRMKTVEYDIVFTDAKQLEIGGFPWMLEAGRAYDGENQGCGLVMNCGFAESSLNTRLDEKKSYWVMTPFIHCWADQYLEWRKFTFKADDLARIASVSIEVVE